MPLGSWRSARARGVFLFVLAGQHAAEQPVQDKPRWPRRSSERRTSHCVVPRTGDDFEASGLAEHWVVKGPSQPRGEGSHDLPTLAPGRAAPPIVGRAEFPAHQGPPSRSKAATCPPQSRQAFASPSAHLCWLLTATSHRRGSPLASRPRQWRRWECPEADLLHAFRFLKRAQVSAAPRVEGVGGGE